MLFAFHLVFLYSVSSHTHTLLRSFAHSFFQLVLRVSRPSCTCQATTSDLNNANIQQNVCFFTKERLFCFIDITEFYCLIFLAYFDFESLCLRSFVALFCSWKLSVKNIHRKTSIEKHQSKKHTTLYQKQDQNHNTKKN